MGAELRGRRWRFGQEPRRKERRQRRQKCRGAADEPGYRRADLLGNLVKGAAQLWSQEAGAAQRTRVGGGLSGPSLASSSSRWRSASRSAARAGEKRFWTESMKPAKPGRAAVSVGAGGLRFRPGGWRRTGQALLACRGRALRGVVSFHPSVIR